MAMATETRESTNEKVERILNDTMKEKEFEAIHPHLRALAKDYALQLDATFEDGMDPGDLNMGIAGYLDGFGAAMALRFEPAE
jgi:hypothetical protein